MQPASWLRWNRGRRSEDSGTKPSRRHLLTSSHGTRSPVFHAELLNDIEQPFRANHTGLRRQLLSRLQRRSLLLELDDPGSGGAQLSSVSRRQAHSRSSIDPILLVSSQHRHCTRLRPLSDPQHEPEPTPSPGAATSTHRVSDHPSDQPYFLRYNSPSGASNRSAAM